MTIDLDKLRQKRAALEARLAATTTTLQEAQRKADTRRRIVLGGTALAAIRDGTLPAWVLPTLVGRMADRDRGLFPEVAMSATGDFEGAGQ